MVIDFTARLNARRAADEQARRDQAAKARTEAKRRELAGKLGDTVAAHIVADVIVSAEQAQRERAPMPAYCDPSNEVRGSKYAATRDLTCKEIAARIRADIKAAIKAGTLPQGLKFRCYMPHHGSIEVRVTGLPEGFRVMSEAGASWRKQCPREWETMPGGCAAEQSDELRQLLDALNRIHGAYNRDNSDSMTDYFDVRYYGRAELDYDVRRQLQAAEVAASPGDYWAEEAVR